MPIWSNAEQCWGNDLHKTPPFLPSQNSPSPAPWGNWSLWVSLCQGCWMVASCLLMGWWLCYQQGRAWLSETSTNMKSHWLSFVPQEGVPETSEHTANKLDVSCEERSGRWAEKRSGRGWMILSGCSHPLAKIYKAKTLLLVNNSIHATCPGQANSDSGKESWPLGGC